MMSPLFFARQVSDVAHASDTTLVRVQAGNRPRAPHPIGPVSATYFYKPVKYAEKVLHTKIFHEN
jgi:hypothetical protein